MSLPITCCMYLFFLLFLATASTEIYSLSLHDALPISGDGQGQGRPDRDGQRHPRVPARLARRHPSGQGHVTRSEEHTSELQSLRHLVCRLLLEKKKKTLQ